MKITDSVHLNRCYNAVNTLSDFCPPNSHNKIARNLISLPFGLNEINCEFVKNSCENSTLDFIYD